METSQLDEISAVLYLCRAYSNDIYTLYSILRMYCKLCNRCILFSIIVLRTHQYLFPVSDSKVPKYTLCTCYQSQLTKIEFFSRLLLYSIQYTSTQKIFKKTLFIGLGFLNKSRFFIDMHMNMKMNMKNYVQMDIRIWIWIWKWRCMCKWIWISIWKFKHLREYE